MDLTYFKSRRDLLFSFIIWIINIFLIAMIYMLNFDYGIIIINGIIIMFLLWIWFGTGYIITKDQLKIKMGPFKGNLELKKIEEVRKATNLWSSAALSRKRLEIKTDSGKWNSKWYVSPRNEEKFIAELKKRNPDIKINI